jgi:hypothetical protein
MLRRVAGCLAGDGGVDVDAFGHRRQLGVAGVDWAGGTSGRALGAGRRALAGALERGGGEAQALVVVDVVGDGDEVVQ